MNGSIGVFLFSFNVSWLIKGGMVLTHFIQDINFNKKFLIETNELRYTIIRLRQDD